MQAPSLSPKQAFEQCKCCLPEGLGILGEFHPLGGWTGKKKKNSLGLGGSWNDQKWGFLATWVGQGQNGARNWQAWAQTGGNWSGNYCASANLLFNKMKCLCSITNTNNRLGFFLQKQHGLFRLLNFFFQFSWAMFTVLSKFSKFECKPSVSMDNNEIIILSWKQDTFQQMKYFSTAYKGWIADWN